MKQAPQHKVAKTASAAKPPARKAPSKAVSRAQQKARHQAAVKAAKTRAQNAKKAAQAKRVQLALGDSLACCAAQALATSLRLAGARVGADDIEALYWLTAGDPDEGASIWATLEAAAEYGLAGYRPQACPGRDAAVILGLEVPGPHAVLAVGDVWWSWGRPWHRSAFPHAAIEEAWAVTW